ncbi:MAG: M28 family peptidase [Gemmatimonadales bacterium]|nr:MAG: M28 family peptidase [Gemmatimonadales bacterium]
MHPSPTNPESPTFPAGHAPDRRAPRSALLLRSPLLLLALLLLPVWGCEGEPAPDAPAEPAAVEAVPPRVPDAEELPETRTMDGPTAEELGVAGPLEGPAERIHRARILLDTDVLSADSMAGRAPGTEGEERAVRYIEGRMAGMGLEPAGADGSYRLPVELVVLEKDVEASSLVIEGPDGPLELVVEENVTFWSTSEEPVVEVEEAPLVFVGHGVQAPEYDWDDFKDEDLSGAILLFLNDDPDVVEDGEALFGGDIRTYYGRWTYKFEQAQARGALGAIVVHTFESAAYDFSVIGNMGERQMWQRDYQLDLLAWMDSTQTSRVAQAMDTDVPGLFQMASDRDFRPVDTGFRVSAEVHTSVDRMEAPNVAGVVRGTDPELADEYLVFTAHHDHLGVDPSLEGDTIFSGALDNALGVASILSVAEAFMEAGPRRSVMFVSVTAEEGGLIGSGLFVESPPVPRDRLVANFNVDSPQSYGLTRDVAAIGIDMNTLGETFSDVVASYGLEPAGDPNPAAGSFYRSDQLSFARAGIPALYLQAGRDYVEDLGFDALERRLEHYHQVSDQIAPEWDLKGVERDLRVFFQVALEVANADERPRWNPGNEFESAFEELYGGS